MSTTNKAPKPVPVPPNVIVEDHPLDTLHRLSEVLAFVDASRFGLMDAPKEAFSGLGHILESCRDALDYEAQRLEAQGVRHG